MPLKRYLVIGLWFAWGLASVAAASSDGEIWKALTQELRLPRAEFVLCGSMKGSRSS